VSGRRGEEGVSEMEGLKRQKKGRKANSLKGGKKTCGKRSGGARKQLEHKGSVSVAERTKLKGGKRHQPVGLDSRRKKEGGPTAAWKLFCKGNITGPGRSSRSDNGKKKIDREILTNRHLK